MLGHIIQDEGTGVGQGSDAEARHCACGVGPRGGQDGVGRVAIPSNRLQGQSIGAQCLSGLNNLSETAPLVDMGVDSLVGMELRLWFPKKLAVYVPVLKILRGASILDLVTGVLEKLPGGISSKLEGASGGRGAGR